MDILSARLLKKEVECKIENLLQELIDKTGLNIQEVRVQITDYHCVGDLPVNKIESCKIVVRL